MAETCNHDCGSCDCGQDTRKKELHEAPDQVHAIWPRPSPSSAVRRASANRRVTGLIGRGHEPQGRAYGHPRR